MTLGDRSLEVTSPPQDLCELLPDGKRARTSLEGAGFGTMLAQYGNTKLLEALTDPMPAGWVRHLHEDYQMPFFWLR